MSGIAFLYQKKELLKDLNRLIKALEIYLAGIIIPIPTKKFMIRDVGILNMIYECCEETEYFIEEEKKYLDDRNMGIGLSDFRLHIEECEKKVLFSDCLYRHRRYFGKVEKKRFQLLRMS